MAMATSQSSPVKLINPLIDMSHRTTDSNPLSPVTMSSDSTPPLSFLISPSALPGFLSNNTPLATMPFSMQKFSIHHQDAEVSIADATDCLRTVSGKIDWFHRKHSFCPHLISADDAIQIAALHPKILIEEVPFLELQGRLREGLFVDIPRELLGRVQVVCDLFDELKHRIDDLITHITPTLIAQH